MISAGVLVEPDFCGVTPTPKMGAMSVKLHRGTNRDGTMVVRQLVPLRLPKQLYAPTPPAQSRA